MRCQGRGLLWADARSSPKGVAKVEWVLGGQVWRATGEFLGSMNARWSGDDQGLSTWP